MRFTEADVDQARAAGVLIEFDGPGRPIIVDRSIYRELVKAAIKRTHDDLQAKASDAAQEKKATRSSTAPADPLTGAKRERDTQLRELTDQAHGANLDLGAALINSVAVVDPGDIEVARFFVLCGDRHRTNYADRLTMRISPCRTPGDGDEAGRGAAKTRSGRPCGEEEDGLQRALIDPLSRGRCSADAGGSRGAPKVPSLPRWLPDRLVLGEVARVLDLDLSVRVPVHRERVDHAHRVALTQALELGDGLAVELRMLEAEHNQLHRADSHRSTFRPWCHGG